MKAYRGTQVFSVLALATLTWLSCSHGPVANEVPVSISASERVLLPITLESSVTPKAESDDIDVQSFMREVVVARNDALVAQAKVIFPKRLKRLDKKFMDLSKKVENRRLRGAVDKRDALRVSYLDLEVDLLKKRYATPSVALLKHARKKGAEKFAPDQLAVAEQSLSRLESFIHERPHDLLKIGALSIATKEDAQRVIAFSESVETKKKLDTSEL